ncbi:GGDEF domain-containing protein [Couchioplanes azureus]|uniref:GGDEF domain-containing protein n=1 Tax=Couchioplanes caeruleus TaxID=56438 RepID=UPI00166FBF92|nr:GGDEF domain-containing protein [Couchioplanes caeruleus]GGQ47729.1 hypothetical protein GCM10010166_14760 [Couchioplanes caeruleus subsp. azureus]
MDQRRAGRLWYGWLAVGCALIAGYAVLPQDHWVSWVYYDGFVAVAVAAVVLGVRHNRPARARLWYLFAAGEACWFGGELIFAYYYLTGDDPYPSPADALFVAGYPLLIAAMFLLIRARRHGRDWAGLIDAGILTTALVMLAWTYVIAPLTAATSMGLAERTVAMAYPAGDLMLLVMATRLFTTRGARTPSYWALSLALVLVTVGDSTFTSLVSLDENYLNLLSDVFWLGSFLAWSLAALHPSMVELSRIHPEQRTRLSRTRLISLTGAALLAPAMLAFHGITAADHIPWVVIAAGSTVMFLLVLVRMHGLAAHAQRQADQLKALARSDGLTGVANRRTWDEAVARMLTTAASTGSAVVVALLDVDHFKRFNDTYGHLAGDTLLIDATAAWQTGLRPEDLLARYGGEEFGVLLPGVSLADAVRRIDALRAVTPFGQTFSAGVASWDGREDPTALMARADQALYAAKHAGRDRVVAAESPEPHPVPPQTLAGLPPRGAGERIPLLPR